MLYLILLILGLLTGGIFLAVLLIGDRKEARLEAERKALQEQITQSNKPVEGAWPPPLSASALLDLSQPVLPPTSASARGRSRNRKMIRAFFLFRNYAAGTAILAYIIYSSFPQFNFGWVLLGTALAVAALWGIITKLRQLRQPVNRL